MIFCIPFLNYDTCQSAATRKRWTSDTRYAFRNCDTRQSAAITERWISDTRYAFRNGYTRQSAATIESRTPDARYAVWYCDTRQSAAISKRWTLDTCTACYNYFFQIFRNIIVVITIRTRTEYVPEMRCAAAVRFSAYKRNSYTCQSAATTERRTTDTRYAFRNCDTRQSAAIIKRRTSDTRYATIVRNNTILTT